MKILKPIDQLQAVKTQLYAFSEDKKRRAAELIIANKELLFQNKEKEKRAAELFIANKELLFQNVEKEKRAAELVIANKELVFQNDQKEKRAAELIIANKELLFQNEEKEKRAAELIIANEELVFQNDQKEKRAAELVIANKELFFQDEEKEKRAAELIIANEELVFQNDQKEMRAAELIIANKELIFQDEEKEKRAAELIIANKELHFQNQEKEKRAEELALANKELVFQNIEREKHAEELAYAHSQLLIQHEKTAKSATALSLLLDELAIQNTEKERKAAELEKAIEDVKASEEQIIEVNKELESFSYSVSHDLRTPLRAINGYAKMLRTNFGSDLNEEANRLINNIANNSVKMGRLIDDLLHFSRVGRREIVKVNLPMQILVEQICKEYHQEFGDNVVLRINQLLDSEGDSMAIKQVWVNLISNAVKYSRLKNPAIVEISSIADKENIIYSIKDNGAGFDMRYVKKLFGVFQRLHSDDEFEGTGVGLALVQRIIVKHGGTVWAKGIVNQGAEFSFTLNKSTAICQPK